MIFSREEKGVWVAPFSPVEREVIKAMLMLVMPLAGAH